MIGRDIADYAENNWTDFMAPLEEVSEGLVSGEMPLYHFDKIIGTMFREGSVPTLADSIIVTEKCIELIEFKRGFKRKITRQNFDKSKCMCPRDGNIYCKDYAELFFKCEDKEIEELKSSIRLKAIESYIILEKDILPECEEQAKQRRIKFIAVIDADDVDAMEETLSELAGGKDNQENSISSLKQSLGRLRSDDRKSYYYDDIEVYTPHEFQLHLEQITG